MWSKHRRARDKSWSKGFGTPSGKIWKHLISGVGERECSLETYDEGECGVGDIKEQATLWIK